MKLRLIVTVEHSAFREFVMTAGIKIIELKFENQREESAWLGIKDTDEVFLFAHPTDESMPAILDAASRMPSLTIIRPIADVRESFARRRKTEENLNKQLANFQKFVAAANPLVLDVAEGMDVIIDKFRKAFP